MKKEIYCLARRKLVRNSKLALLIRNSKLVRNR